MTQLELNVHAAISQVDDPEYPGISIVDLGLLETIDIGPSGAVQIGLVPTFSGCPALQMIAADVAASVSKVDNVDSVEVVWLKSPVWAIDRVSADARETMAKEFTVAVKIGNNTPLCPLCGSPTRELSLFGPSRCRSVSRCDVCNETVEVMRG